MVIYQKGNQLFKCYIIGAGAKPVTWEWKEKGKKSRNIHK